LQINADERISKKVFGRFYQEFIRLPADFESRISEAQNLSEPPFFGASANVESEMIFTTDLGV